MRNALALTLATLALAACTPNDTTLGGAHRHNVALQVIDPEPQYEGVLREGGSGEQAAGAVERYRKGEQKQPVTISTTVGTSGGSGQSGPK